MAPSPKRTPLWTTDHTLPLQVFEICPKYRRFNYQVRRSLKRRVGLSSKMLSSATASRFSIYIPFIVCPLFHGGRGDITPLARRRAPIVWGERAHGHTVACSRASRSGLLTCFCLVAACGAHPFGFVFCWFCCAVCVRRARASAA